MASTMNTTNRITGDTKNPHLNEDERGQGYFSEKKLSKQSTK